MTDTQYEELLATRRAFINLAEAIRTSAEDPKDFRTILRALANLHVDEPLRHSLVETYIYVADDDREVVAEKLALLLDGQQKFDTARFMHHATSDLDTEEGKGSYNRLFQIQPQKITIEGIDPDGGSTETVY